MPPDVAADLGHPPHHRADDPDAVGAVDGQHVGRPHGSGGGLVGHRTHRDVETAVGGEVGQAGLDRARVGIPAADQHHREVAAQEGHRRVLEVQPQVAERGGGLGDDPGPVVADDGDGVEERWLVEPR